VPFENGSERRAIIGSDREVAALIELSCRKAGPIAINAAAAHTSAKHPNDVAMAVIGAAVAVLMNGAAELRHDDDDGIVTMLAEVFGQRGEAVTERPETIGELAFLISLVDVGVPAAEAGKGEPDVLVLSGQVSSRVREETPSWRRMASS
jgi:hypothetical protein